MRKKENIFYEEEFFTKMIFVGQELSKVMEGNMGLRIGQSTVCSQKMHISHPSKPEHVMIMQDIDAGQVFYHHQESGIIYHLDVFHEYGLVDHHVIAQKICSGIDQYNKDYAKYGMDQEIKPVNADLCDIQTGTGGGRITGKLTYGQKLSLRKIHSNHVHLAMALDKEHIPCLVYIIMAIEDGILACLLELRCNEKIENVKGSSKGKVDLSPYAEKSDSLLQDNSGERAFTPYENNQGGNDSLDGFRMDQPLKNFSKQEKGYENPPNEGSAFHNQTMVSPVHEKGVIDLGEEKKKIRPWSTQYMDEWQEYLPDIEIHLRRVMRRAKRNFLKSGQNKILQNSKSSYKGQSVSEHQRERIESGELDISSTVQATARRMIEEKKASFKIHHNDFRYKANKKQLRVEFCLLIDASSSMKGQRIRAAKLLTKFLFFATADPMSVIAFQGNHSWVQVPFTRDIRQLEEGLENIKAAGETPLALGLTACLQHLQNNKVYNPLIILVTDGVPTLGMSTVDPIYDALQVARSIKFKNYNFTCIGLKPHLDYLKELARVANGTIYVVDELEKEGMC